MNIRGGEGMISFVLVPVGGWLAVSTLLGLFLGRVMARRDELEIPVRYVSRRRPRRAA
jgi:hypothetical protein